MRVWLRCLMLLAVILTFGFSYAMLAQVIGTTSPWLALLLMFYVLGIGKVAEPLFTPTMPLALYPLRAWETDRETVRRFGIPGFGKLLRETPLRYLNANVYLDHGRRDGARVFRQAESAEAIHFWAAVLFTPYLVYAAFTGMWKIAVGFSLAQILVNVYPILHLRYVRGRLDRIRARAVAARAHPNPKEPT